MTRKQHRKNKKQRIENKKQEENNNFKETDSCNQEFNEWRENFLHELKREVFILSKKSFSY